MRVWQKPGSGPEKVGVLLYPNFSNHCLANAIEPLRAANMLSGSSLYIWKFLSMDGILVTSSSGVPILPEARLSAEQNGDYLFVMSSYGYGSYVTPANARALRSASTRFSYMVGMDTGSYLMAAADLLDGHRATIHWDEIVPFEETFPAVTVLREGIVRDRNQITCGGAITAFDLVLELIARQHGEALRLEVEDLFMHGRDPGLGPNSGCRDPSRPLDAALALMRANIETPIPIPEIAEKCSISQRSLECRFVETLGATPSKVYRHLRLLDARRYAETTGYSIAEITVRCGYQNAASMTRAFVAEFGDTPTHFRRQAVSRRRRPYTRRIP